ncbi:heavy metal translocating P-type ATPase [Pseudochelatococcus contaminans]|uniref:heavy metal translocating P-type ATPase n=1 Tax=Pseudochelatococcus contaminans TaxID=1538103 RepID=UPI001617EE3C|nr:heavy metal translocating P-type ATPase [Pseudochelatococcus contaminans]
MSVAGDERVRYQVGGMDCPSCAGKIERAVARLPGVSAVEVSVVTGALYVHGGDAASIGRQVEALGYSFDAGTTPDAVQASAGAADPHEHDHQHSHGDGHDHGAGEDSGGGHGHDHASPGGVWWKSAKARLVLLCGLAFLAAYIAVSLAPGLGQWPYLVALLTGLVPIARHAWAGVRSGSPFSIETLMTIAAVGAVFIGAMEEAAMVVLLFMIGEMLEGFAASRARESIKELTRLVPDTALRDHDGTLSEIAASALSPGDIIIARPGDRIAADGVIVDGDSEIDEAPVTGESVPRRKGPGERVFAGTINADAVLRIEVTSRAADNTIARIVRLVEEAQEAKAPTQRFIDRFAARYTPAVLVLGALVAVVPPLVAGEDWVTWIYRGLAVLLIGCPCALVISTPAAIAAGLSAGARQGLLLKGGGVLESLRRVRTIAFDKTGTLTRGRPVVTDVIPFGTEDTEAVIVRAAALERGSSHPLAQAILTRAEGLPELAAASVKAQAGKGVTGTVDGQSIALLAPRAVLAQTPEAEAHLDEAQAAAVEALHGDGKTVSVLVVDGRVAGLIALRDELRPDARPALDALKAHGVKAVMLTGDNRAAANAIAAELGITAHAELLPEDKSRIVRELQAGGGAVAKVGDGINDAPALAAADVGIAMGGGADVALETADAAALHARMGDIPAMLALSRATMTNIWQNITLALGLKGVFLVTTVLGITGLWPAILADTGATVLVTANALRLLRWQAPAERS